MKRTISLIKKAATLFCFILAACCVHAQVGINTENPGAMLDINGDVIIRNTAPTGTDTYNPLYVGSTGRIVAIPDDPLAKIAVLQTTRSIIPNTPATTQNFNNGTLIEINNLSGADYTFNGLGFATDNGYIKVGRDGVFHIAALMNFQFATVANGNNIFMNIRLERKPVGQTTWTPIMGYRPIFTILWNSGQNTPATIPPTVTTLNKDDLLRLVFVRTVATLVDNSTVLQGNDLVSLAVSSGYSVPSVSIVFNKLN